MRLTLEPKSQREQADTVFLICIERTNFLDHPTSWSACSEALHCTPLKQTIAHCPQWSCQKIKRFFKLRIEGIISIASIRGNLIVRSSSIFLHFVSSLSLREVFAGTGYGTLGVYSREGTGSTGVAAEFGSVSVDCSGSSSDKDQLRIVVARPPFACPSLLLIVF